MCNASKCLAPAHFLFFAIVVLSVLSMMTVVACTAGRITVVSLHVIVHLALLYGCLIDFYYISCMLQ